MSGSSHSYPNQDPYFTGIQQIIADSALPGRVPATPGFAGYSWTGARAPNVSPNYSPTAFAPSSATRGLAMQPRGLANPLDTSGSIPSSTTGLSPTDILMQMFSAGAGGSLPGMAGGPSKGQGPPQGAPGVSAGPNVPGSLPIAPYTEGQGISGLTHQQFSDWLNNMFNYGNQGPPGTPIAPLPGLDVATATPGVVNPGQASATDRLGKGFDFQSLMQMLTGSAQQDLGATGAGLAAPPITSPTIDRSGEQVQSLDQILQSVTGGNSTFVNNILPAYQGAFKQSNDLTAAAAKESAGNLTGSGFANTLGSALGRNLPAQQQLLASTITGLGQTELGRQQTAAQLAAGQNTAQAGMDLQARTSSAQLAQQAQALALQARQSGRADLMQQSQMLMQQAITQAQLETNTNQFNAGQTNSANQNYFNAGVNRNLTQAEMDAQRFQNQFGAANTQSAQNAQQFMQLLSMLFGGGQSTTQTQSGAGAILPGLMQLFATLAAGGA